MTPNEINNKLATLHGGKVTSLMYDEYSNLFMLSVMQGDEVDTITITAETYASSDGPTIEVRVS